MELRYFRWGCDPVYAASAVLRGAKLGTISKMKTCSSGPPFGPEGLDVARSIQIAGIDLVSGEAELQHFHLLRAVKHFAGKQSLDEDAEAAKRHAKSHRHDHKNARADKNPVQHHCPWRISRRLARLVPGHLCLVGHCIPQFLGIRSRTRPQNDRQQGPLALDLGLIPFRHFPEGIVQMPQVQFRKLWSWIIDE